MRKFLFCAVLVLLMVSSSFSQEEAFNKCMDNLREYIEARDFAGASDCLKKGRSCPVSGSYLEYINSYLKFHQIKYWEETQDWQHLYSEGKYFKTEIISSCQKILDDPDAAPDLKLQAKALQGLVYYKEQNEEYYDVFSSLLVDMRDYLEAGNELDPALEIASLFYENNVQDFSTKIYRACVKSIKQRDYALEKVKEIAGLLYDKNREFSAEVYEIYLDKSGQTLSKDKYLEELEDVFYRFCDYGFEENYSWQVLFAAGLALDMKNTEASLPAHLKYLMGYNLQRAKDYKEAASMYKEILDKVPAGMQEELIFKIAVLSFFAGDEITFEEYLSMLENRNSQSIYLAPLYYVKAVHQHYLENFEQARDLYRKGQELSLDATPSFSDLGNFLSRTEEAGVLPEKLKIYFDLYTEKIRPQGATTMFISQGKVFTGQTATFDATFYMPGLGCLQPNMIYLWWGALGQEKYPSGGVQKAVYRKEGGMPVFCCIQVPEGYLDRTQDLLDVYNINTEGLKDTYALNEIMQVSASISPYLYEELYKTELVLTRDGEVVEKGKESIKSVLDSAGEYKLLLKIYSFQGQLLRDHEIVSFSVE